jgi:hypothetical protein
LVEILAWEGEVRGVIEEPQVGGNLALLDVDLVVAVEPEDDSDDNSQDDELENPFEDSNIPPERSFRGHACQGAHKEPPDSSVCPKMSLTD